MTQNETPRGNGAIDDLAGGLIGSHSVTDATGMREERLREWSRGFNAAWDYLAPMLDRAERAADHWHFVANNPAEAQAARETNLKAFDIVLARKQMGEKWAELDRIAAERAEAARA